MYGWKRDSVRLGSALIKTPADSQNVIPRTFPCIAKLKHDHFYGRLPKQLKAMVAYLKASTNEKMYYDYLQVAMEAEKEEVMEPSRSQTTKKSSNPKMKSFFPL